MSSKAVPACRSTFTGCSISAEEDHITAASDVSETGYCCQTPDDLASGAGEPSKDINGNRYFCWLPEDMESGKVHCSQTPDDMVFGIGYCSRTPEDMVTGATSYTVRWLDTLELTAFSAQVYYIGPSKSKLKLKSSYQ